MKLVTNFEFRMFRIFSYSSKSKKKKQYLTRSQKQDLEKIFLFTKRKISYVQKLLFYILQVLIMR